MEITRLIIYMASAAAIIAVLVAVINTVLNKVRNSKKAIKRRERVLAEYDKSAAEMQRIREQMNVNRQAFNHAGPSAIKAVQNLGAAVNDFGKSAQGINALTQVNRDKPAMQVDHTLWCPTCGSRNHRPLVHEIFGAAAFKCDGCGQRFYHKQAEEKRWDRNAAEKPADAPSVGIGEWISDYPLPGDQNGVWPPVIVVDESPSPEMGGGDFGGGGAGDSYEAPAQDSPDPTPSND